MPFPVPGRIAEFLRLSTVQIRTESGRQTEASGSGLVLNNGRIITNAHVVTSSDLAVETWDGKVQRARLIKIDKLRDLALLSVERLEAPAATLASEEPRVGQAVIAVGNPLGFVGAVSSGFIQKIGPLGRAMALSGRRWIQSDLRLAPGNSGGPLSDIRGEILGINTMISGKLAFSIPASGVQVFLADKSQRRTLGIIVRPVMLRSPAGPSRSALMVLELTPGGPAERASLLLGDLLVSAGNTPLHSADDLYGVLAEGDTIQLGFLRGTSAQERRVTVQLASPSLVNAA